MERQLDVLLARLEPGDTLMVRELSQMGRAVWPVCRDRAGLISMRTKEALAAALAAGKCRSRPQS